MNMDKDNDQENHEFWSTLIQSFGDSDPKDDLFPEISSPMLVMPTSMVIDVPPEPLNALGDGDKNINEDGGKSKEKEIEKENENGGKDEMMKNVGKRRRSNEARNITEKRRRTDINSKIEDLKELTPCCKNKKDVATAIDCIIDYIRSMKLYVESQCMGPMLPLGMNMDFPAPWFPFAHPNFYMPPPFGHYYTRGETSGHNNQQIVPFTNQGFNNQPQWSKPM